MKMYDVCSDRGDSNMYTQHTIFIEGQKDILKVSPLPHDLINPQWLEQPMSRTNLYGPRDVRAFEI